MTEKYSVLVVDDSAFMRKTISTFIEASEDLYVVGKARNGLDAIEKVRRLKPAIVTLDIEMPELDGLETLNRLMKESPVPVVMLSNGAESTLEAFELGAVDFVIKETLIKNNNHETLQDFYTRLIVAANAKLPLPIMKESVKESNITNLTHMRETSKDRDTKSKELIVIGSSTGGPSALQTILTRFPEDFPIPIVVIQHMPPGFTKPLADRFNSLCQLTVKEAEHNEEVLPGHIYIAPAGLQTTLKKNHQNRYVIKLKISSNIETLYKPSVDVTLLSVAEIAKQHLLTVILTGMGDDGLRGCSLVKKVGGSVLAESEETCVVYGMPKVVFEAGLVDQQSPLPAMYDQMIKYL
ncbi:protein-glutamate methylesterase/protein-glutamine glutaminase [Bacillus pinisoli]|uniref:protein-glutamate methylesterase/protein-glutamine glutaminase n=1 Tax=Bacillus pinisoli TaxID=2901866 RepID=UPI001FF3206B|nr:chemotaxis response regulator protein-glutamate methylesterase [Bacillus pinisoli]